MGKLDLDFTQLSAAELDDQALSEISALLSGLEGAPPVTRLIELAAAGRLVVARRPCGSVPEIIGVAAWTPSGDQRDVMVAVDDASGEGGLAEGLRLRLGSPSAASLFRRRDRAPLGLAQIGL